MVTAASVVVGTVQSASRDPVGWLVGNCPLSWGTKEWVLQAYMYSMRLYASLLDILDYSVHNLRQTKKPFCSTALWRQKSMECLLTAVCPNHLMSVEFVSSIIPNLSVGYWLYMKETNKNDSKTLACIIHVQTTQSSITISSVTACMITTQCYYSIILFSITCVSLFSCHLCLVIQLSVVSRYSTVACVLLFNCHLCLIIQLSLTLCFSREW